MIREREYGAVSGWAALAVLLVGIAAFLWQLIVHARQHDDVLTLASGLGLGWNVAA